MGNSISGMADAAFKSMAQAYKEPLSKLPSVAPLTWEDAGSYKVSPQLKYRQLVHDEANRRSAYDQPELKWQDMTFEQAKAAALGNPLLDEQRLGSLRNDLLARQLTGNEGANASLDSLSGVIGLPSWISGTADPAGWAANLKMSQLQQSGALSREAAMASPEFYNNPYYQTFGASPERAAFLEASAAQLLPGEMYDPMSEYQRQILEQLRQNQSGDGGGG